MTAPGGCPSSWEPPDLRAILREAQDATAAEIRAAGPEQAFELGAELGAIASLLLGRWSSGRGPLVFVASSANAARVERVAWAIGASSVVRRDSSESSRVLFSVAF